jgi:hypothetical protein
VQAVIPRSEIVAVLKAALETSEAIHYDDPEDEVGFHVCCGNPSFRGHKLDCWSHRALALVEALSKEKKK